MSYHIGAFFKHIEIQERIIFYVIQLDYFHETQNSQISLSQPKAAISRTI
ncbi:hypothetical protein GGE08_002155 [Muricauda sp. ARW1Y1]|jgi:hypothetical protein|nr:hypothetical protein [Muricauda sp. ARW1Y1]